MAWESRPVFVSSTFADMQAERDHLRTHVFPALEERLRSRRRHLEWVDLRLGVVAASLKDAEMRELQVLKVCLGEVKRCRPFLIVLLGDRYGWVPPPERIAAAAQEVGFDENITGRSVTDLEIQFGILGDKEQQPRCFFYFRQPLPYPDMPRKVAAVYADAYDMDPDAARRSEGLAALKGEIEARLPQRVRRYTARWDSERQCVTGLDAWGQTVLEDIWSEILATAAPPEAEAEISWQQAERNALDDYIEDRTRDFIGRAEVLSRLEALASSATHASWGLSLTAPAGSGKSAILGELHHRLKQDGVFVLAHATAASTRGASVDDMLRRWIEELGAALGTRPGLADNADADAINAVFQAMITRMARERRVVVLIDGLDQFEDTPRGQFATWVPRLWPANGRLIATAIPCEASKALEGWTGVETLALPPLDAEEARRIAELICARYHRTLEPEVLEALLGRQGEAGPAWGNTLWLVLAVEELNLIDGDDFRRAMRTYTGSTAEQLRALMLDIVADLPTDVLGLYMESFERAEKLFGLALAQAFLGFIAIGWGGWRESDFRMLLPRATGKEWDELQFASLRRLFRGQIRQRGAMGQWDFNHAQMRAAVRQHLTGKDITEAGLHAWAAQHLLMALPPDDPLRQSETMMHLLGAKDWVLAAEFYGAMSLSEAELKGATRVLAESILASRQAGGMGGLDQVLTMLRAVSQTRDGRAAAVAGRTASRLLSNLEPILERRGAHSACAMLLDAIVKIADWLARATADNPPWLALLASTHERFGNLYVARGDLGAALASYRTSHSIFELLASAYPQHAMKQHDLAISLNKIGEVRSAQGDLRAALESYEASRIIRARMVEAEPTNPVWQHALSCSHESIGDIQSMQGDLDAAMKSYRASLFAIQDAAQAEPDNLEWQLDLSASHDRLGDMYRIQQNYNDALSRYRAAHAIRGRLARTDPSDVRWQHGLFVSYVKTGEVLRARSDFDGALDSYRDAHATAKRLTEIEPNNASWQRALSVAFGSVGDVQAAQGDLGAALDSHNASLIIFTRLTQADPSNAEWQRDLSLAHDKIGEVHRARGDLDAALEKYQAAFAIKQLLVNSEPGNARWQRDLALIFEHQAVVKTRLGARVEALDLFRRGREIVARLVAQASNDAILSSDLARFDARIAELEQPATTRASSRRSVQTKDAQARHAAAVSHINIGHERRRQKNCGAALESYQAARTIFQRLLEADPGNIEWLDDLAGAETYIGAIESEQNNLGAALGSFKACLAARDQLVAIDLDNTAWRRLLAETHRNMAVVLEAQGAFRAALDSYAASLAIAKHLTEIDANNAQWQRDIVQSLEYMAAVQAQLRAHEDALHSHRQARDVLKRLKAATPDDTELSRRLAWNDSLIAKLEQMVAMKTVNNQVADGEIKDDEWFKAFAAKSFETGDDHMQRGDLSRALEAYHAAHATLEQLAAAHPETETWQELLLMASDRLGDACRAKGDLPAAIKPYRTAHTIMEALAKTDPENSKWPRLLGISHLRLGEMHQGAGDLPAALKAYADAFVGFWGWVRSDRLNAEAQERTSIAQEKMADMHAALGDRANAITEYQGARARRLELVEIAPGNTRYLHDLGVLQNKLGDLYLAGGNWPAGLMSHQGAYAAFDRLAKADTFNDGWQRDLALSIGRMAVAKQMQGASEDAVVCSDRVGISSRN